MSIYALDMQLMILSTPHEGRVHKNLACISFFFFLEINEEDKI